MIQNIFKTKPLMEIKPPVDKFAIDLKVGDFIPDSFEPKDFAKAWRVTSIANGGKYPFKRVTLRRDKMVIDQTFLNEDKVSVFPKPTQTKSLRAIMKRGDYIKDFLWLYFACTIAFAAYLIGRAY